MSKGIHAHFYMPPGQREPCEIFKKMVQAISLWEGAGNEWRSLKVFDRKEESAVVEQYGSLSAGHLLSATRTYCSSSASIWSDIAFRCWHTAGGEPFRGFEGSTIIARGETWWGEHEGDSRYRGNAELAVWERAPFSILDIAEFGPDVMSWNSYVEENLEILTGGIFQLVDTMRPDSMKVYDGHGDLLPLNANMAYYRDESQVIVDLVFMAELWNNGDHARKIAPLKNGYSRRERGILGAMRSESARERLWNRMTLALAHVDRVTTADVRAVLNSKRYDYYAMAAGFTVLEYPGFMNSYLHNFYLDILESAASS
jgi:hypothetical protein